jgi:hypothetical protein
MATPAPTCRAACPRGPLPGEVPRWTSLLLAGVLAGCGGGGAKDTGPFEVLRTSPPLGAHERILLNQEITVYFSGLVDPMAVSPDTVAVVDARGERVPGDLQPGSRSVTFVPRAPLQPDLLDGSLRPDTDYRLEIAGYPRHAMRSLDGRILFSSFAQKFRTVPFDTRPLGLPSPLLPVVTSLPFLLTVSDAIQPLASDQPRLQLHFTRPILPTSLNPEAFVIELMPRQPKLVRILPRQVRLLPTMTLFDEHPGCTVEIDLGHNVQVSDDGSFCQLEPGDVIGVTLAEGANALTDYGGQTVPMPRAFPPQMWRVIPGGTLPLWEWPVDKEPGFAADPQLRPGFEVLRDGSVRPRVRVEAGNGSLGVFRPRVNTVLVPGVPFDRGDGTMVVSNGNQFPFLCIDVPAGIKVEVQARGPQPVQLLAVGGVRIAGTLVVGSSGVQLRRSPNVRMSASAIIDVVPVCVLAAGDIRITGSIERVVQAPTGSTSLALLTAGRIDGSGHEIPADTLFGLEPLLGGSDEPRITRIAQGEVIPVQLTVGLAPGTVLEVESATPWRAMPMDRDGAMVEVIDRDPGLRVLLQSVPPDPAQPGPPERRATPLPAPREVGDQDVVPFPHGAYVRFLLRAQVRAGEPLPTLRRIRLRTG